MANKTYTHPAYPDMTINIAEDTMKIKMIEIQSRCGYRFKGIHEKDFQIDNPHEDWVFDYLRTVVSDAIRYDLPYGGPESTRVTPHTIAGIIMGDPSQLDDLIPDRDMLSRYTAVLNAAGLYEAEAALLHRGYERGLEEPDIFRKFEL